MATSVQQDLLRLNQKLLESITAGDWETYSSLCDPSLSCFEPEAHGYFIEGMDFHKFYFTLKQEKEVKTTYNTTMSSPNVRLMGDVAVVSYVRVI